MQEIENKNKKLWMLQPGLSINQKVNVPLIRLSLKGMGNEERRLLEEI